MKSSTRLLSSLLILPLVLAGPAAAQFGGIDLLGQSLGSGAPQLPQLLQTNATPAAASLAPAHQNGYSGWTSAVVKLFDPNFNPTSGDAARDGVVELAALKRIPANALQFPGVPVTVDLSTLPLERTVVVRGDLNSVATLVTAMNAFAPAEYKADVDECCQRIATYLRNRVADGRQLDPRRHAAVVIALTQFGQVRALEGTGTLEYGGLGVDASAIPNLPSGQVQNRKGWERLNEYCTVAYGARPWNPVQVTFMNTGMKYLSWCGIYCYWALKRAGFDIGDWQSHLYGVLQSRNAWEQKTQTLPGDIAYHTGGERHMALVVEAGPSGLETVDGNSWYGAVRYADDKKWYSGSDWSTPANELPKGFVYGIYEPEPVARP